MKQIEPLNIEYKNFADKMLEVKKSEFIKLLTGLGTIMFRRRMYFNAKNKKYIYLLNEYLDIPKNKLVLK